MLNFKVYKNLLIFIWVILILLIFVSSLKTQVVLGERTKTQLNTFFPEGWSFFTRNPREPLLEAYKIENNKIIIIPLSNSSFENFFGFSRKSRVKGFEASVIVSDIPSTVWKEDKGTDYAKHINDNIVNVKLKNTNQYFKKGKYMFVLRKPIPWAWAGKNQDKFSPYSVIISNVR